MIEATRSGVRTFLFCSAGKKPGNNRVHRYLGFGPFTGKVLCTAALVAEYVKTRDNGMMPLIEPVLMMLPPSPPDHEILTKHL